MSLLAAALVGIIALLAIPLELGFSLRREPQLQARLELLWLYGWIRVPLERSPARPRRPAPAAAPSGRRRRRRGPDLARLGDLLDPLARLLRRLRRRVHVRRLRLDARIGLDDPADTGRLWGLLWPMLALAPTSTGSVRVQPDFSGEVLWIDAEGQLWLRPLAVLAAVLAFVASPALWRAVIGRRGRA